MQCTIYCIINLYYKMCIYFIFSLLVLMQKQLSKQDFLKSFQSIIDEKIRHEQNLEDSRTKAQKDIDDAKKERLGVLKDLDNPVLKDYTHWTKLPAIKRDDNVLDFYSSKFFETMGKCTDINSVLEWGETIVKKVPVLCTDSWNGEPVSKCDTQTIDKAFSDRKDRKDRKDKKTLKDHKDKKDCKDHKDLWDDEHEANSSGPRGLAVIASPSKYELIEIDFDESSGTKKAENATMSFDISKTIKKYTNTCMKYKTYITCERVAILIDEFKRIGNHTSAEWFPVRNDMEFLAVARVFNTYILVSALKTTIHFVRNLGALKYIKDLHEYKLDIDYTLALEKLWSM